VKFTTTQENTLRIIKRVFDRAYSRSVSDIKRRNVKFIANAVLAKQLDDIWSKLAARRKCPTTFDHLAEEDTLFMRALAEKTFLSTVRQYDIERMILRDLHSHAAEYELMSQMPRVKRERKPRQPRTLVEERAYSTAEKIKQWERKLKFAQGKLKMYRQRKKRYDKKGVVV